MPRGIKKTTTDSQLTVEAPVIASEAIPEEVNTMTTQEAKIQPEASQEVVTLVLSNGNLTTVIREAFYLGKLGGKATPKFLPRLKSPPYIIKVDLSPEAFELYGRSDGRVEHDPEVKYTNLVIRTPDPLKLIQSVLDVGAKGGIITPKKVAQSGLTLIVNALIEGDYESNPVVNVLPSK